jgi:hypothetical protein
MISTQRRLSLAHGISCAIILLCTGAVAAAPPDANKADNANNGNADASTSCSQLDFFNNLTGVYGPTGVETLKTTWGRFYTQPLDGSSPTSEDIKSWAIRVGSAASVGTGSNATKTQLLNQDSGLYDIYVSFIKARTATNKAKGANGPTSKLDCTDPMVNARHFAEDRVYFGDIASTSSLFFVSNGVGFRGLGNSTSASGSASGGGTGGSSSSATSLAGAYWTIYAGLGFDGRVSALNGDSSTRSGYTSVQALYSWNKLNQTAETAASKAFSGANANQYETLGLKLELYATDYFALRLEYAKGLGGFGKAFLGDMVSVNFATSTSGTSNTKAAASPNAK